MYPLSNQARKQKSNPQSGRHITITAIRTSERRETRERLRKELHADSTRSRHQLRPYESSERLSRSALILTRTALSTTVRPTTPQLLYLLPAPEMAGAPKKGSRDAKPLTPYTDQISFPVAAATLFAEYRGSTSMGASPRRSTSSQDCRPWTSTQVLSEVLIHSRPASSTKKPSTWSQAARVHELPLAGTLRLGLAADVGLFLTRGAVRKNPCPLITRSCG